MKSSTNNWLKKIFSVGTISLIVSIIGLWLTYKTLLIDTGGELKVEFSTEAKKLSEEKNPIVYISNPTDVEINNLLPQFQNNSKYVLKDFYLRYEFCGDGFSIEPTGFYEETTSRGVTSLTYRSDKLPVGMLAENPVELLSISGNTANVTVKVTASFNGGEGPYNYTETFHFNNGSKPITSSAVPKPTETSQVSDELTADQSTATDTEIKATEQNSNSNVTIIILLCFLLIVFLITVISSIAFFEGLIEAIFENKPFWNTLRDTFYEEFAFDFLIKVKPMRELCFFMGMMGNLAFIFLILFGIYNIFSY